jgi:hypothetical protein
MKMGVYLPDMAMPKPGEVIRIYNNGEARRCHVTEQEAFEVGIAVPIPPHGDLIDRREAIIDANERAYDFWLSDDEVNATIQFLEEQPTIIPAEEDADIQKEFMQNWHEEDSE